MLIRGNSVHVLIGRFWVISVFPEMNDWGTNGCKPFVVRISGRQSPLWFVQPIFARTILTAPHNSSLDWSPGLSPLSFLHSKIIWKKRSERSIPVPIDWSSMSSITSGSFKNVHRRPVFTNLKQHMYEHEGMHNRFVLLMKYCGEIIPSPLLLRW